MDVDMQPRLIDQKCLGWAHFSASSPPLLHFLFSPVILFDVTEPGSWHFKLTCNRASTAKDTFQLNYTSLLHFDCTFTVTHQSIVISGKGLSRYQRDIMFMNGHIKPLQQLRNCFNPIKHIISTMKIRNNAPHSHKLIYGTQDAIMIHIGKLSVSTVQRVNDKQEAASPSLSLSNLGLLNNPRENAPHV